MNSFAVKQINYHVLSQILKRLTKIIEQFHFMKSFMKNYVAFNGLALLFLMINKWLLFSPVLISNINICRYIQLGISKKFFKTVKHPEMTAVEISDM